MLRKYWHIAAGLLCVAVLGVVYVAGNRSKPNGDPARIPVSAYTPAPSATAAPAEIKVHIEGAVQNPGVYTLSEGSRVDDLLQLAGGPTEDADLIRINLASFLYDAQQVIIPAVGSEIVSPAYTPNTADISGEAAQSGGLININTATESQLSELPGIGPAIASYIVEYRNQNGGFASIDEIKNVRRIGDATFEDIKDLITVN